MGATESFDSFFRREYPRLVPMLHAVLGDRGAAEDVAQEALAAAQRDWSRIAAYDRPGAWVRRVALNRAANTRRGRGREARALHRVAGGERLRAVAAEPPPLPDQALWAKVRALPDQQRTAVLLHYVEDRTLSDIAVVLRCSEGTVKTHLARARATLARHLPDRDSEVSS